MAAFVGREIQFGATTLHPGVITQRVQGTVHYLLANGNVLKDDDTLGVSATERIRVRYGKARDQSKMPIFQLSYEAHSAR